MYLSFSINVKCDGNMVAILNELQHVLKKDITSTKENLYMIHSL